MPDIRLPKVAFCIPPRSAMKRKSPDSNLAVAMDTNRQVDRFKRQKNDDDDNSIDLTPSHRIPDVLGPATADLVLTRSTGEPQTSLPQAPLLESQASRITPKSQHSLLPSPLLETNSQSMPNSIGVQPHQPNNSRQLQPVRSSPLPRYSNQSTLTPEPQSSISPTAADQVPSNWGPAEWDDDVFDSDGENMSLAVTMRLANELSLLKSFLGIYKKFNIHLGDIVSGPRHKGFLTLITSTVTKIESHAAHLRTLRDEKQRGNPTPSFLEHVAGKIARRCKSRRKYLWAIMEEKVDMGDEVARARWVKKKRAVLRDVMGGLVGYLEELGGEEGWKEREVREMGERWERRWKVYGAMDRADLKKAGWILEVG